MITLTTLQAVALLLAIVTMTIIIAQPFRVKRVVTKTNLSFTQRDLQAVADCMLIEIRSLLKVTEETVINTVNIGELFGEKVFAQKKRRGGSRAGVNKLPDFPVYPKNASPAQRKEVDRKFKNRMKSRERRMKARALSAN